jgi:hypothetical protein
MDKINSKKKKWANYIVGILIVGLVGSYVPILLIKPSRPLSQQESLPPSFDNKNQAAINSEKALNADASTTKKEPTKEGAVYQGFADIEKESEELKKLDGQLNGN